MKSKMSITEKREALGNLGEKVARNYFSVLNYQILDSSTKYDSEKDFEIVKNGKVETVEVKTQHPYFLMNAFTIPASHLKKCQKVDRLIFVQPPHPSNNDEIIIWEAISRKFRPYTSKFGEAYYLKLDSFVKRSTYRSRDIILEMIQFDTSYSRKIS